MSASLAAGRPIMSDEENYEGVVPADDFDQAVVGDDNVDDAPEPEGEEGAGSTYTQYVWTRGCGRVLCRRRRRSEGVAG